eukprot:g25109.t1
MRAGSPGLGRPQRRADLCLLRPPLNLRPPCATEPRPAHGRTGTGRGSGAVAATGGRLTRDHLRTVPCPAGVCGGHAAGLVSLVPGAGGSRPASA